MLVPMTTSTAGPSYGFADLPALMSLMAGDEKHDFAAASTLDVLWVLYDRVLRISPETLGATIRLPIAHGEGNYRIDEAGLARLEANHQVLLRYAENPNGSLAGIAGVRNERGNVFGMMPHPDRAFERFHPSQDGLAVARAVLAVKFPELLRRAS